MAKYVKSSHNKLTDEIIFNYFFFKLGCFALMTNDLLSVNSSLTFRNQFPNHLIISTLIQGQLNFVEMVYLAVIPVCKGFNLIFYHFVSTITVFASVKVLYSQLLKILDHRVSTIDNLKYWECG